MSYMNIMLNETDLQCSRYLVVPINLYIDRLYLCIGDSYFFRKDLMRLRYVYELIIKK